jgi:tetratricopeptide (TPR) repeat protein
MYLEFIKKYPKHKYYRISLFQAGILSFEKANYQDSTKLFTSLIEIGGNDEVIANAYYKRVFSYYFLGYINEAFEDINNLVENYASSDFTYNILNWQANYLISVNEYKKGIKVFDKIVELYPKNQQRVYDAITGKALIYIKLTNDEKALESLEQVITETNISELREKAIYLEAGIYSENQEYDKAVKLYEEIYKNSKSEELKLGACGRLADCYFSMYNDKYNTEFLEKAGNNYLKIIKSKNIDREFYLQSLYKLARCYQLMGFEKKAISNFKELIYDYRSEPGVGKLWFVKTSNSLVEIYLKKKKPEYAKKAILIYKDLIARKIKPVEDYKAEILKIKKRYRL